MTKLKKLETAPEAKEEATAAKPEEVAAAPKPVGQMTRVEVWARQKFGAKHLDQASAVIKTQLRKKDLALRSIPEWEEAYQSFMSKPVGQK